MGIESNRLRKTLRKGLRKTQRKQRGGVPKTQVKKGINLNNAVRRREKAQEALRKQKRLESTAQLRRTSDAGAEGMAEGDGIAAAAAPVAAQWNRRLLTEREQFLMDTRITFSEWIHDWWNGYRNRSGGAEINAIILQSLIYYIRQLPEYAPSLRQVDGGDDVGADVNKYMSILYNTHSIVTSQIEAKTIYALENGIHPWLTPQSPLARITFAEVIDANGNGTLVGKMIEFRNNYYTITFDPGEMNVRTMDLGQRKIILYALRIFVSGLDAHNIILLPKFDAAGKDFSKLVKGDEYMSMVHTPAVAADSASTSLIKIGVLPNLYITANPARADLQNIFARPKYGLRLTPTKFNDLNPFGFTYDILYQGTLMSSSSFGMGTATQGPSLDYLMELFLHTHSDPNGRNYLGFQNIIPYNCLNISKDFTAAAYTRVCTDIRTNIPVFPALKQDGDGRQIAEMGDVAEALRNQGIDGFLMFVSQDRQAVELAKIEIFKKENAARKLVVVQHQPGGALTVTRNDAGMDPAALAAYNAQRRIKYMNDNYSLLQGVVGLAGKIARFLPAEVIPGNISTRAIQYLYSLKITDIKQQLINIGSIVEQGGAGAAAAVVNAIDQVKAMAVIPDEALVSIENEIKRIYSLFEATNISVSILSSLNTLAPDTQFNPATSYSFLGYSLNDFIEIDKIVRVESAATTNALNRTPRVPFNPLDILYRKNGFFEMIDDIADSFFNTDTIAFIKSAFILETPETAEPIKDAQKRIVGYIEKEKEHKNELTVLKRNYAGLEAARILAINATNYLRTIEKSYFDRIASAGAAVRGGAYLQHGGVMGTMEFEALEEIFAEAAIFINSYFIAVSEGILVEGEGDNRDYTITHNPNPESPDKIQKFHAILTMISLSAAATKANELLVKLNASIDGIELSDHDTRVINFMRMLLDPFVAGPIGETGVRTLDVIRADHIVFQLWALFATTPIENLEDKISIWGLMVFAYLGELVTSRISIERTKSLFGEILGYPNRNTVDGFTIESKWDIMLIDPRRHTAAAAAAAATAAPTGLLVDLFIAMVKGKYAAAGLLGGARKTRYRRKQRNTNRKMRRQ